MIQSVLTSLDYVKQMYLNDNLFILNSNILTIKYTLDKETPRGNTRV
jgi:hypothetical protein